MQHDRSKQNRELVSLAMETLFNRRDYEAAERFWSDDYAQHSAIVAPGREGLFGLVRSLPDLRYERGLMVSEGDHVMVHGRYTGNGRPRAFVAVDIFRIQNGRLVEHWDVLQDEAVQAESAGGLAMFGSDFPTD